MNTNTRPAAIDDTLYETHGKRGEVGRVTVTAPPPHPDSGVSRAMPLVSLVASVRLPTSFSSLDPAFVQRSRSCAGERLNPNWGTYQTGRREKVREFDGDSVAETLQRARTWVDDALAVAADVAGTHQASVDRLESARAAALAAYPVVAQ
jgi:hypothetical protein